MCAQRAPHLGDVDANLDIAGELRTTVDID